MELEFTWGEAARATGGTLARGRPDARLRSLSTDSRALRRGQAFWALRGERFDAHDFLDARLARAASGWVVRDGAPLSGPLPPAVLRVPDTLRALAALARAHRDRFSVPVVAVTGSNGKTTVKEMLRAVLARRGPVCANAGNLNNEIGVPLSVLELRPEHRHAVFELGASRAGDIRALCGVAGPTLGVLTNIGPAHLEFFGDEAGVFRAKSELVDGLPAGAPVALNLDDPWLKQLLPRLGDRARTFGRAPGADARVVAEIEPGVIRLELAGRRVEARSVGFAATHRINAAAAAAAALALGFSPEEIAAGLEEFRPAPLRFARRAHASGARLMIDAYNANPASMRAGLETFLELEPRGRRLAVLGDMAELGPQAPRLHRELGEWLARRPLAGAFLAGALMREAAAGLREAKAPYPVEHAERAEELAAPLKRALGPDAAVYFKASRAFRLETLAETL